MTRTRRAQTWWWSMFTWRGSAGIQPGSSLGNRTSLSSSRQGSQQEHLLINGAVSFLVGLQRTVSDWSSSGFLPQWCQFSAASFRLWLNYSLQVASQTQVLLVSVLLEKSRSLNEPLKRAAFSRFFCVAVLSWLVPGTSFINTNNSKLVHLLGRHEQFKK